MLLLLREVESKDEHDAAKTKTERKHSRAASSQPMQEEGRALSGRWPRYMWRSSGWTRASTTRRQPAGGLPLRRAIGAGNWTGVGLVLGVAWRGSFWLPRLEARRKGTMCLVTLNTRARAFSAQGSVLTVKIQFRAAPSHEQAPGCASNTTSHGPTHAPATTPATSPAGGSCSPAPTHAYSSYTHARRWRQTRVRTGFAPC